MRPDIPRESDIGNIRGECDNLGGRMGQEGYQNGGYLVKQPCQADAGARSTLAREGPRDADGVYPLARRARLPSRLLKSRLRR